MWKQNALADSRVAYLINYTRQYSDMRAAPMTIVKHNKDTKSAIPKDDSDKKYILWVSTSPLKPLAIIACSYLS